MSPAAEPQASVAGELHRHPREVPSAIPPQSGPQPLLEIPSSPGQTIAVDIMLLFWLAAIVIAVWGSVTESARAERERRRALATNEEQGPTPGIDGFLERWGMWALIFGAAGLAMLGYISMVAHR